MSDDVDKLDVGWLSVEPNGPPVDLPFLSAMSLRTTSATSRGDVRYHRTPRLLLQVQGWESAYPVAVDRLGIFFRTLYLDPNVPEVSISSLYTFSIALKMHSLACIVLCR